MTQPIRDSKESSEGDLVRSPPRELPSGPSSCRSLRVPPPSLRRLDPSLSVRILGPFHCSPRFHFPDDSVDNFSLRGFMGLYACYMRVVLALLQIISWEHANISSSSMSWYLLPIGFSRSLARAKEIPADTRLDGFPSSLV